jgi:hypothetical protein
MDKISEKITEKKYLENYGQHLEINFTEKQLNIF